MEASGLEARIVEGGTSIDGWGDRFEPASPDNQALMRQAAAAFAGLKGPQQGDWLVFDDGERRRVAHVWGDGVQPSLYGDGNIHLSSTGCASYSGGLGSLVKNERLKPDGFAPGLFWIFDRGRARAGAAVTVSASCRVFRVEGRTTP